jgi:hypothetical protein
MLDHCQTYKKQKMRCGLTEKVLNNEESRQRGQDHGAGEEHQFLNDRAENLLIKKKTSKLHKP